MVAKQDERVEHASVQSVEFLAASIFLSLGCHGMQYLFVPSNVYVLSVGGVSSGSNPFVQKAHAADGNKR